MIYIPAPPKAKGPTEGPPQLTVAHRRPTEEPTGAPPVPHRRHNQPGESNCSLYAQPEESTQLRSQLLTFF